MVWRGSERRKGSQRVQQHSWETNANAWSLPEQVEGVKGSSRSERDGVQGQVGWMVSNITGLRHTGQGKAKLGKESILLKPPICTFKLTFIQTYYNANGNFGFSCLRLFS